MRNFLEYMGSAVLGFLQGSLYGIIFWTIVIAICLILFSAIANAAEAVPIREMELSDDRSGPSGVPDYSPLYLDPDSPPVYPVTRYTGEESIACNEILQRYIGLLEQRINALETRYTNVILKMSEATEEEEAP